VDELEFQVPQITARIFLAFVIIAVVRGVVVVLRDICG
jgi:hypothetical protein